MESNYLRGTGGALFALKTLDDFELDSSIRSDADYGREYLSRQLPDDFDMSFLSTEYLSSVGSKILDHKGGSLTSYGAVSGLGQELYSAITVHEEELDEDEEHGMEAIQ